MVAQRDGRIGAMMGGVARSIGNETQDLAALERRRLQAEKLQRKDPQVAFADLLHANRDARARAAEEARLRRPADPERTDELVAPAAEQGARAVSQPAARHNNDRFVPRGRQRLIRG